MVLESTYECGEWNPNTRLEKKYATTTTIICTITFLPDHHHEVRLTQLTQQPHRTNLTKITVLIIQGLSNFFREIEMSREIGRKNDLQTQCALPFIYCKKIWGSHNTRFSIMYGLFILNGTPSCFQIIASVQWKVILVLYLGTATVLQRWGSTYI